MRCLSWALLPEGRVGFDAGCERFGFFPQWLLILKEGKNCYLCSAWGWRWRAWEVKMCLPELQSVVPLGD